MVDAHTRFDYFSDIEEHYQRRRGTLLPLCSLDWVLMETWKEAGIPLEAVLRGIDATFDRYDARPSKTRKVNSLAYCSQEVLAAAEQMQEASTGATRRPERETGFEAERIAAYLRGNAAELKAATQRAPEAARAVISEAARKLEELAAALVAAVEASASGSHSLEDLERRLTVLEEKIFAAVLAAIPDEHIVAVRAEADRELSPYRRKMSGAQIEQLQKQYLHKRLLDQYGLPRLSLFYM